MKNYRALLFDLEHTVFDFDRAEEIALRYAYQNQNIPFYEDSLTIYRKRNLELWHGIEKGIYSMNDLRKLRFPSLFPQADLDFDRLESDLQEGLTENVFLMEGAYEVLKTLSERYKIYAASNGFVQMQKRRLHLAGIDSFFDGVFVSDEVGFSKPDQRFFDFLLNKIKIDKSEVLMIGDSLSSDIQGGINAHIDTCLVNTNKVDRDRSVATYSYPNLKEMMGDLLMKEIVTKNAQETKAVAERLAEHLEEGSLLILTGDLGAGKITFTQGLAKGLGVKGKVISPTFTIMRVYHGRLPLYHNDAYRLEGVSQDLGFEEYMEDDGVCVIEWPVFIRGILPEDYLKIDITYLDEDERKLTFVPKGRKYEKIMEDLC